MIKRLLRLTTALLVAMLVCSLISQAEAASSDTVAVQVTVTPSISVSITEGTLSLGSIAAGQTTLSATGVTVTNDGSGVNETYSLSLADPSGWTASQTAAGVETYVLNAAFDVDGTGISWSNANHALSTGVTPCTASKFAGDQTGLGVLYNTTRKLWFQFMAPTATTVNIEQSIVITVTAQAS